MEPELKTACWKAGIKVGIGLTLVVAVVGIRMISATPEGVPAAIEKLERLDSELAAESAANERAAAASHENAGESIVSRLGAGMADHFSSSDAGPREGDRLVSCRRNGRTQFMRADDCAVRGGESTDLKDKR